jgi:hypothetical protein
MTDAADIRYAPEALRDFAKALFVPPASKRKRPQPSPTIWWRPTSWATPPTASHWRLVSAERGRRHHEMRWDAEIISPIAGLRSPGADSACPAHG